MSHSRRDFIKSSVNASIGGALALHNGVPLFANVAISKTNIHETNQVESRVKRPNILLLFPDQWRFDWISANPHLPIRTPNLDRRGRQELVSPMWLSHVRCVRLPEPASLLVWNTAKLE